MYAKVKGPFQTDGTYASATVRGTYWLLADRCDGTFEHTFEGTVSVLDKHLHRTRLVHAGQTYLARKP